MTYIRIPFLARSEQGLPLQRALDLAANKIGVSPFTMAIAASHLFEQLAEEVARGRVFRVPGFGVFAPCLDERRQYLARRGGPRCVPKFSAAKGFRQEVMLRAPPSRAGKMALKVHRSNQRFTGDCIGPERIFTAARALRDQISTQLGRCIDTGDRETKRGSTRGVACP
jgi:hypothetical protein